MQESCFYPLKTNNLNSMKTGRRKRKNRKEFKLNIRHNNLMNRFIREIEREEPLEFESLQTMLVYQPMIVR